MKKGFTLIELLVVIAVIGILVSIMFSVLRGNDLKVDPATQLATGSPVVGVVLPEATNYAIDTAGVLTASELSDLNAKLKAVDTGKVQIAVLVLKTTTPLSIDEYGIKLAEKWRVGMKGLDNGAIIIIATDDRKVRLDIGYGLEGAIPDAVAGNIIRDDMGPLLHNNQWYDAIVVGINSVEAKIK